MIDFLFVQVNCIMFKFNMINYKNNALFRTFSRAILSHVYEYHVNKKKK